MELRCTSCDANFEKPGVRPGDAVMCPRCRSLVDVPRPAPVPAAIAAPPPRPPPARVPDPVPAPPLVEHTGAAGGEPSAKRGGADAAGHPPHVALRRQCPWCRRRYDAEARVCPACGLSAARAQMSRAALEEQEQTRSGRRLLGTRSPAAYAIGVVGVLGMAVIENGSPAAWIILAVILLAGGWVVWRVGTKARAARDARAVRARRHERAL